MGSSPFTTRAFLRLPPTTAFDPGPADDDARRPRVRSRNLFTTSPPTCSTAEASSPSSSSTPSSPKTGFPRSSPQARHDPQTPSRDVGGGAGAPRSASRARLRYCRSALPLGRAGVAHPLQAELLLRLFSSHRTDTSSAGHRKQDHHLLPGAHRDRPPPAGASRFAPEAHQARTPARP